MTAGDARQATRRHRWVGAALAVVLVTGTAACGSSSDSGSKGGGGTKPTAGSWEEIEASANDEGKVTLYSQQVLPILDEMEKTFEATYPDIDLEVVRGLPQDLIPKIEAERQTNKGIGDVYVNADAQWSATADEGGFYTAPEGPNFEADGYDPDNVKGGYFLSHAVVFGWSWNTELVPDGIDSYEDLLDPSLSGGKVGVIEPGGQALTDFWLYLEDNLGEDFVDDLADQDPRVYGGGGPVQEALIAGEVSASLYAGAAVEDGKAAGAPIEWKIPDNPWGARYWGGVLSTAPHPNAAQVFVNWMVSPEGQEVVAKGNASTLPDIEGTLVELSDVPEQDMDKLTPEFVADYFADWKQQFQ